MSPVDHSHDDCPVDDNTRQWINARASWLIHQFGRQRVRDCPVVLPLAQFFPAAYTTTEDGVRAMLDQVAQYLDIDPKCVELSLYDESSRIDGGVTTLGLFEQGEQQHRIWIEASQLHNPLSVAATIAHELGHVLLLGQKRVSEDADDHEPLTDLLTVFLGLGVITANAAFHSESWSSGTWSSWNISRRGYLTMPMFGYALALFSRFRDEDNPLWTQHLRLDVRHAYKKSLQYFERHGMPELRSIIITDARPTLVNASREEGDPDSADAADETDDDSGCNYCGAELLDPNSTEGLCRECHRSIRENTRERRLEWRRSLLAARRNRKFIKIGLVALLALGFVLTLLEWLGVISSNR